MVKGANNHFDLVVCGGGLVGSSLVNAILPSLEKLGMRIALIEQKPIQTTANPEFQPSFDARSTALARGSRTAFEAMGLWTQLTKHLEPIAQIQVSDRGRFGQVNMRASEEGVEALGYVVENHWMGQVLMHNIQAVKSDSLRLFSPAEVLDLSPEIEGQRVTVETEPGKQLELFADLVVMADGGRSDLRRRIGIEYREHDYHQHALIANIALDRPHKQIAYERFTEEGPIALLPIENHQRQHRMGLVWTLPEGQVGEKMQLSDADFLNELQEAFGYRAGAFVKVGQRFNYPLKLSLADEQARQGLVVLGNAAHSLHPIAGQGFNLALRGVCELAQRIIERRSQGESISDLAMLNEFLRNRFSDQQRTISFGNSTLKLFMDTNALVRCSRSAGLEVMNNIPVARTLLARAAMGLDTPVAGLSVDD